MSRVKNLTNKQPQLRVSFISETVFLLIRVRDILMNTKMDPYDSSLIVGNNCNGRICYEGGWAWSFNLRRGVKRYNCVPLIIEESRELWCLRKIPDMIHGPLP